MKKLKFNLVLMPKYIDHPVISIPGEKEFNEDDEFLKNILKEKIELELAVQKALGYLVFLDKVEVND